MKRLTAISLLTLLSSSSVFATSGHGDKKNISYTIGYTVGTAMQKQMAHLDPSVVAKGWNDGFAGKKSKLTEAQMKSAMMDYRKQMLAGLHKKGSKLADENEKQGEEFLAKNAKKSDVKTLSSGVQYKIIKQGSGKVPVKTDSVTVDYEGSLINGNVFDSSYKRGQPATFKLNQVIPGWTDALSHMKQGSTWMIYIPADKAYGRQAPPSIGPNQVLIFKVHLIKVN